MSKPSHRKYLKSPSMKGETFKALIGFILILLFIFVISSFFVNDGNNSNSNTGGNEDNNRNLITFTVGQTTLQAESGMTWSQWLVDPKYNTDDFVKNGEYISIGAENLYLCMKNGTGVKLSDTILEGGVYYFIMLRPDPDTGEDDNPVFITFTVGETTLQAESGMTWEEWLNSTYNYGDFKINYNYICIGSYSEYAVFTSEGTVVLKNDKIIDGAKYYYSQTPSNSPLEFGKGYIISAYNKSGLIYVVETTTSGRFNTTQDASEAAVFYIQYAPGSNELLLYYLDYGIKNYVIMNNKADGAAFTVDVSKATSFVWNDTLNTMVVADPENNRAFGAEISSNSSYISTFVVTTVTKNWGQFIPVDSPDLITFTVGQTTLQAESGMTWEEWLNSTYNYGDFNINYNYICTGSYSEYAVFTSEGTVVLKNDKIIDGAKYYCSQTPSNSPLEFGKGYIISAYNKSGLIYVVETTTSGRFNTTQDASKAAVFYIQYASGSNEFLLYYLDYGIKNYVIMNNKADGAAFTVDVSKATSFVWNDTLNTMVVADPKNNRAFGAEISSNSSYISTFVVTTVTKNWGQFIPVDSIENPDSGEGGESENPDLITFTVGNGTLQAESGMTWSQWLVDPKYNTDDFVKNGEYISIGAENFCLCMKDGTRVKLSDTILAGGLYYFLML